MARIRLTKEFSFESAHALDGYDGLCREIHGHSYRLFVTIKGEPSCEENDPKLGMVMDFGDLKRIVNREIVDRLDHSFVLRDSEQNVELKALLGAKLERGIEMVLGAMRFDEIIAGSDLVITGEGRLDAQTVMGKAPSGVLSAARRQGIPCIAIGGGVRWCEELRGSDFAAILPIVSAPMALEEAMRCDVAAQNVERTAQQVGRMLKIKLN